MPSISLRINGQDHSLDVDPDTPLLWALRDGLGLTGTKFGCGIGECGACTVLIDGQAVRSCQMTAAEAAGTSILTIEGLGQDGLHPVQKIWKELEVPQCGYCQPGQILTLVPLLEASPRPSPERIETEMSTVLCRCGTYPRIRAAIRKAVKEVPR